MKSERLFEAIGLVDDHLVEEAAEARRTAAPWGRWLTLAACLVFIIGVGSLAAGTMLRGCGSSSTDMAAPENAAGSAMDDAAESDAADAPAAAPPGDAGGMMDDLPEEEAAEGAADTEDFSFGYYADPVLPLTAMGGESLLAARHTRFDVEPGAEFAAVTDGYAVENPTGEDVTATFCYPVAASLNGYEEAGLEIAVDGAAADYETFGGAPLAGFTEDGLNLDWRRSWQELEPLLSDGSYLAGTLTDVTLDQPVTVWRFVDLRYDEASLPEAASLAVWFEKPADGLILTYGINGYGEQGGRACYDFFLRNITLRGETRQELVFLGGAPEGYTVRAYVDGGMEQELDGVTGGIAVRTTTLGAYLQELTDGDLEYQTLTDVMLAAVLGEEPLLRYRPAMLNGLLLADNRAMPRVFYAVFDVTIPAGETVELTASYRKEASHNFHLGPDSDTDLFGFDLLTTLGSDLTFTEQSASLTLPEQGVALEGDSFGFAGGADAALNLNEPHYDLTLRIS